MRDREKLREALAKELMIGEFGFGTLDDSNRPHWYPRADRVIALFDQHTAPQAEPAAEAKVAGWTARDAFNMQEAAWRALGEPARTWPDDGIGWVDHLIRERNGLLQKLGNPLMRVDDAGNVSIVKCNECATLRQRAEAAEKERDKEREVAKIASGVAMAANGEAVRLMKERDDLKTVVRAQARLLAEK